MFSDSRVFATVAVSDITKGKEFYGTKLGLQQVDENPGGVTYESGGGRLFIYQSPTAGSGQATCAAWEVSNISEVVQELVAKGITFEHYDFPGGTRDGDIHIMGPMKAAWFKDPDGNILSVAG
ncbi:MAG: VOC family protein [Candidatus Saccharibacteria bacterium]|nr:VOC family protein [Candidatus Saccharibacteria bacterium]